MSTPGINILMYHQIGDFSSVKRHQSTYVHYRRFAQQMQYLARFGYTVLRMDEAVDCLKGARPTPPKAVVLTFDDGYENFYEYAWPVLQQHQFPSMVYLISSLMGQPASWFASDGRATPPLMSASRVRALRSQGVDFGSHGVSHVKLAEQTTERIQTEVSDSRASLADCLGEEIRHFCYPYGSHDMRAVLAVAEAGYTTAVTCERAPATSQDDLLTLPRKAISYGDNLLGFFWKLHVKNSPKRPPIRRDEIASSREQDETG